MKISMEVLDISNATDAEVARAVSYSEDEVSWDSGTAIGSYTSTPGWSYGSAYATLDVTKRFARLGLLVKQTSGAGDSNNENVRVNLDINLKPR